MCHSGTWAFATSVAVASLTTSRRRILLLQNRASK
jgi:hypothetical protein